MIYVTMGKFLNVLVAIGTVYVIQMDIVIVSKAGAVEHVSNQQVNFNQFYLILVIEILFN